MTQPDPIFEAHVNEIVHNEKLHNPFSKLSNRIHQCPVIVSADNTLRGYVENNFRYRYVTDPKRFKLMPCSTMYQKINKQLSFTFQDMTLTYRDQNYLIQAIKSSNYQTNTFSFLKNAEDGKCYFVLSYDFSSKIGIITEDLDHIFLYYLNEEMNNRAEIALNLERDFDYNMGSVLDSFYNDVKLENRFKISSRTYGKFANKSMELEDTMPDVLKFARSAIFNDTYSSNFHDEQINIPLYEQTAGESLVLNIDNHAFMYAARTYRENTLKHRLFQNSLSPVTLNKIGSSIEFSEAEERIMQIIINKFDINLDIIYKLMGTKMPINFIFEIKPDSNTYYELETGIEIEYKDIEVIYPLLYTLQHEFNNVTISNLLLDMIHFTQESNQHKKE